jgi:hypothetical protein
VEPGKLAEELEALLGVGLSAGPLERRLQEFDRALEAAPARRDQSQPLEGARAGVAVVEGIGRAQRAPEQLLGLLEAVERDEHHRLRHLLARNGRGVFEIRQVSGERLRCRRAA